MKVKGLKLLLICLSSLVFTYCKSEGDEVDQTIANFSVNKDAGYLHSSFEFEAVAPKNGFKYNWDFGDGTLLETGYKATHNYRREGTYTVTLNVGGVISSKEVLVYPGTISYQIQNQSSHDLVFESYIDNPEDFGLVMLQLRSGVTSEKIFSKSHIIGGANGGALMGIFLTHNNVKYLYRHTPNWLTLFQNHLIVLNDSTELIKVRSNDIGPAKLLIGDL